MSGRLPPYDLRLAEQELAVADPDMARLMARVGRCRLRLRAHPDLFDALLHSVVHQQLSGIAAARIHERVIACCEAHHDKRAKALLACPQQVLLEAGLSRPKLRSLRGIAGQVVSGALPTRCRLAAMDEKSLIATLTALPGVGAWTVQMLLMQWLGRADVLPTTDLGVRKGLARLRRYHELPAAAQVAEEGRRWRPWCSVASWYLWRAAEEKHSGAGGTVRTRGVGQCA